MPKYLPARGVPVTFPFFDGPVYIRKLPLLASIHLRHRFLNPTDNIGDRSNLFAASIAAVITDENGNAVLTPGEVVMMDDDHLAQMLPAIREAGAIDRVEPPVEVPAVAPAV